jgi:outer membrane protein assembly factor BamB
MTFRLAFAASLIVATARLQVAAADENWPHWRGPHANGTVTAANLPTTWSATENIVWKAELPAWSGGTPIIWGDRIFVTSPTKSAAAAGAAGGIPSPPAPALQQPAQEPGRGGGRGRGQGGGRRGGGFGRGGARDPGGSTLLLLCLSRQDGHLLWQRELDEGNQLQRKQNSSSPSPVTDGNRVWVVTGTGAVAAFEMDGTLAWKRNIQTEYGPFQLNWGYASSPLLHDGRLIIQVLHGFRRRDPSYVVAFNAQTGDPLWKVERPTDAPSESPDAYTTPAIATVAGKPQLIVSGGDYVTGHDPATGVELWRAAGLNPNKDRAYRIVASPVVVGDLIFAPSRRTPLLALQAGGAEGFRNIWTWTDNGAPDVPTPATDGTYFYMVDDSGSVSCVDVKSGERLWGPQRTAVGTVSSSPIVADGKLYVINEAAVTTVLAAGPEFRLLATNELDGSYTLSSPVVAGNQLFIRTGTYLYCIAAAVAE